MIIPNRPKQKRKSYAPPADRSSFMIHKSNKRLLSGQYDQLPATTSLSPSRQYMHMSTFPSPTRVSKSTGDSFHERTAYSKYKVTENDYAHNEDYMEPTRNKQVLKIFYCCISFFCNNVFNICTVSVIT